MIKKFIVMNGNEPLTCEVEVAEIRGGMANELMIKSCETCVQEHDKLIKDYENEIYALNGTIRFQASILYRTEQRLQEAKDMLKELDPFESNGGCYCAICGDIIPDHKPDCKYIKMIGDVK